MTRPTRTALALLASALALLATSCTPPAIYFDEAESFATSDGRDSGLSPRVARARIWVDPVPIAYSRRQTNDSPTAEPIRVTIEVHNRLDRLIELDPTRLRLLDGEREALAFARAIIYENWYDDTGDEADW